MLEDTETQGGEISCSVPCSHKPESWQSRNWPKISSHCVNLQLFPTSCALLKTTQNHIYSHLEVAVKRVFYKDYENLKTISTIITYWVYRLKD